MGDPGWHMAALQMPQPMPRAALKAVNYSSPDRGRRACKRPADDVLVPAFD
jgi:hypothetical protein